MYPVTICTYDVNFNRVMTIFWKEAPVEQLLLSFSMVMLFSRNMNDISWHSVTGLHVGVDNTNVNIGAHDY